MQNGLIIKWEQPKLVKALIRAIMTSCLLLLGEICRRALTLSAFRELQRNGKVRLAHLIVRAPCCWTCGSNIYSIFNRCHALSATPTLIFIKHRESLTFSFDCKKHATRHAGVRRRRVHHPGGGRLVDHVSVVKVAEAHWKNKTRIFEPKNSDAKVLIQKIMKIFSSCGVIFVNSFWF